MCSIFSEEACVFISRHVIVISSTQTAAYKHNTVNLGMLRSGGLSAMHAGRSMTLNLQTKSKFENQMHQELPLPKVSMR